MYPSPDGMACYYHDCVSPPVDLGATAGGLLRLQSCLSEITLSRHPPAALETKETSLA